MKARLAAGVVAAVLIAIAVYWLARGRSHGDDTTAAQQDTRASQGPSVRAETAPADARAQVAPHRAALTTAERTALLQAIETSRSRRAATPRPPKAPIATGAADTSATTLDIIDRTGDTSAWEKRTLGTLNTLLGECYDLGRAEDPKLEGTLMLRFTLAGEPEVGGLLERVDIIDENTSIKQQTLRDCVSQQLYALELDPPPDGVRVEREVTLKFP